MVNKNQFLKQLAFCLQKIDKKEAQEILKDYEEHFAFGYEEGKTEEEISASLGSPEQIAKEILATYPLEKIEKTEKKETPGNIMRAIWATIGLSFFNLVIVLGPFIALFSILLSFWVVGISFTLSPLLVVVDAVIHIELFNLFELFISITLCGIGIFLCLGMIYVTKGFIKGMIRYLKFNISLVKGGLK